MSDLREIRVPDIGTDEEVDVVELLVAPGDEVEIDQGLLVLSSDKASMDLPSPVAGTIRKLEVEAGGKVKEGDLVALLEPAEAEEPAAERDRAEPAARASDDGQPDAADEDAGPAAAALQAEARTAAATESASDEPATKQGAPQSRPASDEHAPLVVIGSGPGGYSAAFRAADLGLEVTLVERYPTLGGVCLNVGCIPSKALLHAAEIVDEAAAFAERGIRFGEPEIDLAALGAWKDGVVGRLTGGLADMAKRRKVRVVQATATFTGPDRLRLSGDDGERFLTFDQAIIAAGSRPVRLPFLPEDPRIVDSTGALALSDLPQRLLIVGGGIIGLEMGCVYAALGSRVSVVELLDGLIPEADRDLVRPLDKRLRESFEAIWLGTEITGVEAKKKELVATFEGDDAPQTAAFDRILVAVGRKPNGASIGAEAAGVEVDERGFIPVDNRMRTNRTHIFAIGDIAGPPMLAHKAVHEGKVAAEVAAGEKSAFDARAVPSVAYTDPEVAWVGLTESAAKRDGVAYERASFPWAASGRALALGRGDGLTKLLIDPESHRILGAGAAGPHAGDLISEAALAIEMGAEAADVALTVHPHPTLSETVAMAAEAYEGTLTDLYVPRRKKRRSSG